MTQKTSTPLRPLGVVAAGDSRRTAMRNFLRLKSHDTAAQEAGLFGLALSGDAGTGHFLVSMAAVTNPFNPLNGKPTAKKFTMQASSQERVLSLFGATDRATLMTAYASAETSPPTFEAVCACCTHVSISDRQSLLKNCTVCGEGLPQDDEGDENVGFTITDQDPDEDGDGDGDGDNDGEQDATNQEASATDDGGTSQDDDDPTQQDNEGTDPAALDGVNPSVEGDDEDDAGDSELNDEGSQGDRANFAGTASDDGDENLGEGSPDPETVPLVSEDDSQDDQGDDNDGAGNDGAGESGDATAADGGDTASGGTYDGSDTAPSDANDKGGEGDTNDGGTTDDAGDGDTSSGDSGDGSDSDDQGDDEGDNDGSAPPEGNGSNPDGNGTEGQSESLSADYMVTVNALDDVVAADATPGNTATRLIFVPSMAGDNQWMALVNGMPAATCTAAQAEKANPDLAKKFSDSAFANATVALCSQIGLREGLKSVGFEAYAFDLPIGKAVESKVNQAVASAQDQAGKAIEEVAGGIQAALSASWMAHAKNFFAEDSNELKAAMFDALASSGVMNAADMVESVFIQAGDEFGRSLIARAFSLLEMDVASRNQVVTAIQKANVAVPGTSVASATAEFSHALANFGAPGTATAGSRVPASSIKAGGKLDEARHLANTVASLAVKPRNF